MVLPSSRIESEATASLVVPAALQSQLEGWLQGDRQLLQEASHQRVLQVMLQGGHEAGVLAPGV